MKVRKMKKTIIFIVAAILVMNIFSLATNNVFADEDVTKINLDEITDSKINITEAGTYELTGTLENGQLRIDANEIDGDVVIVLNNANITCEDEPAILVYSKSITDTKCSVTIKTVEGTTNEISGGKIKVSVIDEEQSEIPYYIEKDYDDDGTYYERYKYDGAISSDVSLTFEGEGTLVVNSLKKEGIESKQNITFNSGNYEINSLDDGINACTDNVSVITINGGTILVDVTDEAEEGDAIDSNGSIYINGGYVYAFACESSQDNGIDADQGIYINGGYVVATGNMADAASSDSKQAYLQLQFNDKVEADNLITIVDKNDNPVVAFETGRAYSILTISVPNLTTEDITVYEGGTIEGKSENGLYKEITSYTKGTQKEYSNIEEHAMGMPGEFETNMMNNTTSNDKVLYIMILAFTIILVILVIVLINLKKKGSFSMKGKVLTLIIGILIGAILATGGFLIYNKVNSNNNQNNMSNGPQMNGDRPSMPDENNSSDSSDSNSSNSQRPTRPSNSNSSDGNSSNGQMPGNGQKPDGEPPAKPGEDNNSKTTNNSSNTESNT